MKKFDEDAVLGELIEAVTELLMDYIPGDVTCPSCEREFELTEINWDGLIDAVTEFVLEHSGR